MNQIKPGDHVLHRPSGETWVVAYADPTDDALSACGWPESRARLSDCDLVKSVSPDESAAMIDSWLDRPHSSDDHRPRTIRQLYRNPETQTRN